MTRNNHSLTVSICLLAFAGDLVFPSNLTAIAVWVPMLFLLWVQGRTLAAQNGVDRHLRTIRWILFGVASLFVGARVWVFLHSVGSSEVFSWTQMSRGARTYDVLFAACMLTVWSLGRNATLASKYIRSIWRRPAAVLSGSFMVLIAGAAVLLTLPISLHRIEDVSFVDALFTATSAVCVTGLVVNDTALTYSTFGELVILIAIQLGAIGIMTVAALALFLRREAGLTPESRLLKVLGAESLRDLRRTVWRIILITITVELVGALALYTLFLGDGRLGGRSSFWMALFHSVSAFANAGFGLFPRNLAMFRGDYAIQAVVMALIFLGGIGFPVLWALVGEWRVERWRMVRKSRLPLGARVALKMSALLIVGGASLFAVLESSGVLLSMDFFDRLFAALFMSVTARTAGFDTVAVHALQPATLMFLMLLMFIGGSPGGTAGGIKTSTAAVLASTLRAELRRREPQLLKRSISQDTIRRAVAVVAISALVVFMALFLLLLIEPLPFSSLAFETVSAFGTVGLSTGITPKLTVAGKIVIMFTMFAGRVGPLTIALAIGGALRTEKHVFPTEELSVG